jgi:predicted chitinase
VWAHDVLPDAEVEHLAHQLEHLEQHNQTQSTPQWLLDTRSAAVQAAFPLDANTQQQLRQRLAVFQRHHPSIRLYVLVSYIVVHTIQESRLYDWAQAKGHPLSIDNSEAYTADQTQAILDHWKPAEEDRDEEDKVLLLHYQQVLSGAACYWKVHYGVDVRFTSDFNQRFSSSLRLVADNATIAVNPTNHIYTNIQRVDAAIDNPAAAASKYKIQTYIGDTLMTLNKVYIPTHMNHDPIFSFIPTDSSTAFVNIKLKIVSAQHKSGVFYPATGYLKLDKNRRITLDVDSLEEGKYQIQCEGSNSCLVNYFYVRKKKHDFACKFCGRDLTITNSFIKTINRNILFFENYPLQLLVINAYLKKYNLNSCKGISHILSQIIVETKYLKVFEEDMTYSLPNMLTTFRDKSTVQDIFFKQSFWDNKQYLRYVASSETYIKVDTNRTVKGQYVSSNSKNYYYKFDNTKYVTICDAFNFKKGKGDFNKYSFSTGQKEENKKRLFSLVYSNKYGNGDTTSEDGYKYAGKGLIHLTWKENYIKYSRLANAEFQTSYDWEKHPEEIKNNPTAIVHSGLVFLKDKLNFPELHNKTCAEVSQLVNGGNNGASERLNYFTIINNLLLCYK